uniref:Uncharacterized protein n=1 Tax=Arundo donax TaxID=35708 RepID=A0A0A9FYL1_ARUDO
MCTTPVQVEVLAVFGAQAQLFQIKRQQQGPKISNISNLVIEPFLPTYILASLLL